MVTFFKRMNLNSDFIYKLILIMKKLLLYNIYKKYLRGAF